MKLLAKLLNPLQHFLLFLSLCTTSVVASAQDDQPAPSLNIGDPAPQLQIRAWVKGTPIEKLEKSNIYVLEFWATWCHPCMAAMPHLSVLAAKYKNKVTFLGIDVYEKTTTPLGKIKAVVDSMGNRMDFNIAEEDSNFMAANWIDSTGEQTNGIPRSFVVDAKGRLAWVGYPTELDEVLPKIVNNTWNIKAVLNKRNLDRHLEALDEDAGLKVVKYTNAMGVFDPAYLGQPDSVLWLMKRIVNKEPRLKYAPMVGGNTFSALLKTDPHQAYEFGKSLIVTPTYTGPDYLGISESIDWYSDKLKLPSEIYLLGAEALQKYIDHLPYPELINVFKHYHKMAEFYWHANDSLKAIEAEQKAIENMKTKKDFSEKDLVAYETRLQEYKKKWQAQ